MAETDASGTPTPFVPATPTGPAATATTIASTPTDPRTQERPLENATPSTPAQIAQLYRAQLETQGYSSTVADEFEKLLPKMTDAIKQVMSWDAKIAYSEASSVPPKSARLNFKLTVSQSLKDKEDAQVTAAIKACDDAIATCMTTLRDNIIIVQKKQRDHSRDLCQETTVKTLTQLAWDLTPQICAKNSINLAAQGPTDPLYRPLPTIIAAAVFKAVTTTNPASTRDILYDGPLFRDVLLHHLKKALNPTTPFTEDGLNSSSSPQEKSLINTIFKAIQNVPSTVIQPIYAHLQYLNRLREMEATVKKQKLLAEQKERDDDIADGIREAGTLEDGSVRRYIDQQLEQQRIRHSRKGLNSTGGPAARKNGKASANNNSKPNNPKGKPPPKGKGPHNAKHQRKVRFAPGNGKGKPKPNQKAGKGNRNSKAKSRGKNRDE